MRHFILQSIAAAGMLLAVDIAVIVVRVVLAQKNVATAFTVPPETEVVFIGNSHTGCTFAEAPEFRNRVIWHSSTGFVLNYLRFLELERRGAFDANMKVCVLDCDASCLLGCARGRIANDFILMLPLTWRYWDRSLLTKSEMLRAVLTHPSKRFSFSSTPPPEIPNWTTRSKAEREKVTKAMGAEVLRFRITDAASDDYPHDWRNRILDIIRDMKARCDRHGVRLILFAAPVASDDVVRMNPDVETLTTWFTARVRTLGVEFYDFSLTCADEKFRDAGHLLPSSSYEFTKRFYAEVLKIPVATDSYLCSEAETGSNTINSSEQQIERYPEPFIQEE